MASIKEKKAMLVTCLWKYNEFKMKIVFMICKIYLTFDLKLI